MTWEYQASTKIMECHWLILHFDFSTHKCHTFSFPDSPIPRHFINKELRYLPQSRVLEIMTQKQRFTEMRVSHS